MRFESLKIAALMLFGALFALSGDASGFSEIVGACEPDCSKCHQLSQSDAAEIVRKVNPTVEVVSVEAGPVRGLWEVVVKAEGKKGIAYLDFSKKHLIVGSIVDADTKDNLTSRRLNELNKVDLSEIPLSDALVMGSVEAKIKVVVFDDPE